MFEKTGIRIGSSDFEVRLTDEAVLVGDNKIESPEMSLDGRLVTVKLNDRVERFLVNRNGDELWLTYGGRLLPLVIETDRDRLLKAAAHAAEGEHGASVVKAAMPGLVVRVNVTVGQEVKRGDAVLILEAMKMENEVRSPVDGKVQAILVSERDSVEKGAQLISLTK